MAGLNRVQLIGNLGKDPELRYTQNSTPYAKFTLATSETYNDRNGERQEKTTWHNLVVWGKQAEIAGRYLHKGKQVYVEGRIEYRDFQGEDGQRKFFTDIKVDRFLMLGQRGQGGGYDQGPGPGGPGPQGPQGGGYGGGGYGGGAPNQGPPPQSYGGGAPAEPMSYGSQGGGGNYGGAPASDDFNDDDIPF